MGEWVDPTELEFGYIFSCDRQGTDLEHCHAVSVAAPRSTFDWRGRKVPTNLEGSINPLARELLFQPRLTLYLNRPDWANHFHKPRYTVVLGRSQDLATYTSVAAIELEQRDHAYYEDTLLPFDWRTRVGRGVTLTMPRMVDYARRREPQFARYVALQERSLTPKWLSFEGKPLTHWADPESPPFQGLLRAVPIHSFTDSQGGNLG